MKGPVLVEFLYELRSSGLPVSLNQWLALMKALELGLHRSSLTGFYNVSRSLLAVSEADFDTFDKAFAFFFKGIEEESMELSEELLDWLKIPRAFMDTLRPEERKFFEEMDLDELRKMFEDTLREQRERHDGGNRWVGTGGRSPFGWGGFYPGGIRVGGRGLRGSAVQIAARRLFREYRKDMVLDVRRIGVALRKLRELTREGAKEELDIDATIDATCKNAGELDFIYAPQRRNNVRVLLLMDVGGSMTPHARLVSRLFSAAAASSHFREFRYYYFHNCVYEQVYERANFGDPVPVSDILRSTSSNYKLVVVGDACMHPMELMSPGGAIHYWERNLRPGLEWLKDLARFYDRRVWLNPDSPRLWRHVTVRSVRRLFPMFPLTIKGIEDAVDTLVKSRKASNKEGLEESLPGNEDEFFYNPRARW